jgi:TolB-like protein/tRNA A-37 threonylcarbamoyl transferase component Bud32
MDPVVEQIARSLAQTFRVERELGGGGMSRVFLSTEIALGRRVVLKVLTPEMTEGVSIDRFRREILLAARLHHAHIVPLLSAGEAGGLPWFSMPFVEGESLRARLLRGELPIEDVVRTLRDVASALAYAHARGVVHRDIKPDNVLLAEGGAQVADFGVAKALADAGLTTGSDLTAAGIALGTPAYMSPEQVAGDARTDGRADIYALGVMAYEMLSGWNPFARNTTHATMNAHHTDIPPPVEKSRASTPPALAQLVSRCLAKSPADRPQTAQEVVDALERIAPASTAGGSASAMSPTLLTATSAPTMVIAPRRVRPMRPVAVVAGVLIVGTAVWFGTGALRGPTLDHNSVAVVPFENLTGDSALTQVGQIAADYIAQGIAQADSVKVISSSAVDMIVSASKGSSVDIVQRVGKTTGAATIVTGTIAKVGDSLSVQASIVDPRSGQIVLALDPVKGPAGDPLVAIGAVRERLLTRFVGKELALAVGGTGQPPKYSAYREYIEGSALFPTNQIAARRFFARAIELDSTFAHPYSDLAITYVNSGDWDTAERIIGLLDGRREKLGSTDRDLLELLHALLRGDGVAVSRGALYLYERTSWPIWSFVGGLYANHLLQPRVSIPALERVDSTMMRNAPGQQASVLGEAYHQAGDYLLQLAKLEQGRTLAPSSARVVNEVFRAFAGLRDGSRAIALADTILRSVSDPASTSSITAIVTGASEFGAHGDTTTAAQLVRMGLEWCARHRPSTPVPSRDGAEARLLVLVGAEDSAAALFRRARKDTMDISHSGWLGVLAARKGDRVRAVAIGDSLQSLPRRWLRGTNLYWRAAILGALGERDESVRLLRQANAQGSPMESWHYDEALAALRDFPAFQALIRPKT